MTEDIRVFIRSMSRGAGVPVAHVQCEFLQKGAHMDPTRGSTWIPQDVAPLLYSAEKAAEELGCQLHVIDINRLGFLQKLKEKLSGKPIPRVVIGSRVVTGLPTKKELIEIYRQVCK